jgi:transcriptional regulator with XRE-family HTH domain
VPKEVLRIRETEIQRCAVASAIRALRADAQLTQKTLAEKSSLSLSWISRLESEAHESTFESMRRLACGLGVSLWRSWPKTSKRSNRASERRDR